MQKVVIWFSKIIAANFMWVIFTILGFAFFGFFPATVALLTVTKEIKNKKVDKSIFSSFLKSYVGHFLEANFYGYLLVAINFSCWLILYYFIDIPVYLSAPLIALTILVFIISLLFFPTYIYFDADIINLIKITAIITLSNPVIPFVVGTVILMYYIIIFQTNFLIIFPTIFLFVIFSLGAYLIHILITPAINKFRLIDN